MEMIFSVIQDVPQTSRPSILILVLVGLLVLGAISLVVYLFNRSKSSEKESEEEDWRQGRHTLMLDVEPEIHPSKAVAEAAETSIEKAKTAEDERETDELVSPFVDKGVPTAHAEETASTEVTAPVESPARSDIVIEPAAIPILEERATPEHLQPEPLPATAEHASPFGEEIWSELESPKQTEVAASHHIESIESKVFEPVESAPVSAAPAESAETVERPAAHVTPAPTSQQSQPPVAMAREPYEPPRIEQVVGRKGTAARPLIPQGAKPVDASASVRSPRPEAPIRRWEPSDRPSIEAHQPVTVPEPDHTAVPEPVIATTAAARIAEGSTKRMPEVAKAAAPAAEPMIVRPSKKSGGSVLGLPAETSDKPLILGEPVSRASVETLSTYGTTPKESGGRGGTIALAVVVGIIAIIIGSYLLIPSLHAKVNNWMAQVKGIDLSDQTPKAQIFRGTTDNTINPVKVNGAVQNVSKDNLSGLKVVIMLQPKDQEAPPTIESPVAPDQLAPNQEGLFTFELDANKFSGYKFVGLRGGDGSKIPYTTPAQ